MFDKYVYRGLHFIMKYAGALNAWAWRKHVVILRSWQDNHKPKGIIKHSNIKQHYIRSLINFDKYDNIVEQIIKEKQSHGNKRRQKNSQDTKKDEN
jgi:hypothetical protein|tara:strand:+ start:312 stop:599 length:288 start_codon:yes stop_codon:yes gene_type:complete